MLEDIYVKILAFSSYGFPESHAISFAYLVYASAALLVPRPADGRNTDSTMIDLEDIAVLNEHRSELRHPQPGCTMWPTELQMPTWGASSLRCLTRSGFPGPDFEMTHAVQRSTRTSSAGSWQHTRSRSRP